MADDLESRYKAQVAQAKAQPQPTADHERETQKLKSEVMKAQSAVPGHSIEIIDDSRDEDEKPAPAVELDAVTKEQMAHAIGAAAQMKTPTLSA